MYSIVDIETTGGLASANSITEIAILVHDGTKVVREFQTLVNPLQPITPFVTRLTGISNAMVASAPMFEEIAEEVYSILHNKIFIAHNVQFDYSYIDMQLKKCGFLLRAPRLCTVQMSRKFIPGMDSYSLGRLCRSLGIKVEDRHRALGDARATAVVFERILENGGIAHINKTVKNAKLTL